MAKTDAWIAQLPRRKAGGAYKDLFGVDADADRMPVEHDIKSFGLTTFDGPGCEDNASSTDAHVLRCYNLALDTPNITEDVLSSFNEDHPDATSVVFFSDKATEGVSLFRVTDLFITQRPYVASKLTQIHGRALRTQAKMAADAFGDNAFGHETNVHEYFVGGRPQEDVRRYFERLP